MTRRDVLGLWWIGCGLAASSGYQAVPGENATEVKEHNQRGLRRGSSSRDPFQAIELDETMLTQGTEEFVFMFRNAGTRTRTAEGFVLELSEFMFVFNTGWKCGDLCRAYANKSDIEDGISKLEACCAVRVMFEGWACASAMSRRPCYQLKTDKFDRRAPPLRRDVVHAVIAGGMIDAVGIIVAARSAVDAARDPRAIKLYIVVDADDADITRLEHALRCALQVEGVDYRIAKIDAGFLEDRSATFRELFSVTINKTRTRKTLIKAPANYARMYIPDLFAELGGQLVVYLDSDVLVSTDLQRLTREARKSFSNHVDRDLLPAVAGTKKTSSHANYEQVWRVRYPNEPRNISVFNAGVMVINESRWDALKLTGTAESWLVDNLVGGSQMPINLAIASNFAEVSKNWNCAIRASKFHSKSNDALRDSCVRDPHIRHWTGRFKPWLPKASAHLRFFWWAHANRVRGCFKFLDLPLNKHGAAATEDDVSSPWSRRRVGMRLDHQEMRRRTASSEQQPALSP